jgi:hypothetical protein
VLCGEQSREQTERKCSHLARLKPAQGCRMALQTTGSFRLGAGRSQVQILSPRLEIPANCILLVGNVIAARGPIRPSGSKFGDRAGNGVWRHDVARGHLFAPGSDSHRIDHVRTSAAGSRRRELGTQPGRRSSPEDGVHPGSQPERDLPPRSTSNPSGWAGLSGAKTRGPHPAALRPSLDDNSSV